MAKKLRYRRMSVAKKIRYRRITVVEPVEPGTTISPATDEPIGGVASVEDMLTLALVMAVMIVDMAIRG